MSIEIISIAVGAAGAVLSATLSAYAKRQGQHFRTANSQSDERDFRADVRLCETESLLSDEETRSKLYRYSSVSLIFSQFVVGGILATSFVSKHLGDEAIGALGLIVLGSSLINQHFRPDLLHKASAQKARQLRCLKREIEDDLFEALRNSPDETVIVKIRKKATAALLAIEQSEESLLYNDKNKNS